MNPSINNGAFYGRKLSIQGVNVNNATDKQLILKEDYNNGYTIYYDTNGNPSVLLGNRAKNTNNGLAANQQGLYVGKTGINVLNATDSQLIFNSNQDVFKIVGSGTITNTVSGTLASGATNTVSMAHGLSFTPGVLGFISGTGSSYLVAGTNYQTPYLVTAALPGGVPEILNYNFTVDATNVNTNIYNMGGVGIASIGTTVFKYFLLQETAN